MILTAALLEKRIAAMGIGWLKVLRADPCSYCHTRNPGKVGVMTIDHIAPIKGPTAGDRAKRGPWYNKTCACSKCNSTKGSWSLLYFMVKHRDFLHKRLEEK